MPSSHQARVDPEEASSNIPSANHTETEECSLLPQAEYGRSTNESDASTHAFLRRVYTHLKSMGQLFPRNLSRPAEEVLVECVPCPSLLPLERKTADEYIDCFYTHSNATYRYIRRRQLDTLLDGFYRQDPSVLQDDSGMAVLLMVLAVGCIWLPSLRDLNLPEYKSKASYLFETAQFRISKSISVFLPTVEILQAHCLKCQFLLAVNMFNSAWLALGKAVRLGQIVNFHLAPTSHQSEEHEFSQRGLFWSLYMMDRYLSVALGRPVAINDEDITISYPKPFDSKSSSELAAQENRTIAGVVAHIKLTQITSQVLKGLFAVKKQDLPARNNLVTGLENRLEMWLAETPSFFHPEARERNEKADFLFDVPWIIKRQQRTIRAAFCFTSMLLYRGYLLDKLVEVDRSNTKARLPSPPVQKCVDAAMRMASFAAEIRNDKTYNAVFWTTSYFTFCAISILTVYLTLYPGVENRASIESLLESAMEGHRKLDNSTNKHSQKLLEEAHLIAKRAHEEGTMTNIPSYNNPNNMPISSSSSSMLMSNNPLNQDHQAEGPVNTEAEIIPQMYENESVNNTDIGEDELGFIMNMGFDVPLFDAVTAFPAAQNFNQFGP